MYEDAGGRGGKRRAGGAEVRALAPKVEAPVDAGALVALRSVFGDMFDERFEDAAFEVSERLVRIAASVAREDLPLAAREAGEIGAPLSRIGLASAAAVAKDLVTVCSAGDAIAACAISARLLRAGEEGLIRAAELSVDLNGRAEGA